MSDIPHDAQDQNDLLTFEEHPLMQYTTASQGQRFVNWLIDNLLMRFAMSYPAGMLLGFILAEVAPETLYEISDGGMSSMILLLAYVVVIFNYLVYYTLCEKLFKGYTLGKLISGTRAIRQDGGELTFKDALLRSLSRLVPFEVFSGFNTFAWHDQWTNTMVVRSR